MINWLLQSEHDLPPGDPAAWLGPAERTRIAGLRIEKRRREWLLGRWTAKRLLQSWCRAQGRLVPDLARLEIIAAPDGAPLIGLTPPASLSISHSRGRAFCALISGPGSRVGADIEQIAPRPAGFAAAYYTPMEQELVAAMPADRRDLLVTAIWSAKEAVLKALHVGLTADTATIECRLDLPENGQLPVDWRPFMVGCGPQLQDAAGQLGGWWRVVDGYILSLALASDMPPIVGRLHPAA